MRKKIIALACGAAMFGGIVTGCKSSAGTAGTTPPPNASTPATVTAPSSSASTSATHAAPKPAAVPHVGQAVTVKDDGGTYTVTVTAPRPAKGGILYTAKPGQKLVAVTITYHVTQGKASPNPLWFTLRDAAGNTYNAALGDMDQQLSSDDVVAGETARGPVAFEVPATAKITSVVMSSPLGDRQATWLV